MLSTPATERPGGRFMINGCGSVPVDALVTPFPPVRPALRTMIKLRSVSGLTCVRQLLASASAAFEQEFGGPAVRLLLAEKRFARRHSVGWRGLGFLGLLLIMLGQTVGFLVPEGGAGRLSEATRDRFVKSRGRGGMQRRGDQDHC
jgi:phytoene dehydrogenase-like protein